MPRRLENAALAVAVLSVTLATAACMPAPSGNEINFADEGRKNGAAAARGLTSVALEDLAIGKSVNDDHTIKEEADSFQPNDTIHASIRVSGAANSGLVRAAWIDEKGAHVQDDTRIVSPSRGEVVSVQLARTQGLAGGRYRIDIFLDDRLVDSAEFSVEGGRTEGPGPQRGRQAPDPTGH